MNRSPQRSPSPNPPTNDHGKLIVQPLPLGAGVAPSAVAAFAVGLAVRVFVIAGVDLLPAGVISPCAAVRVTLGLLTAPR